MICRSRELFMQNRRKFVGLFARRSINNGRSTLGLGQQLQRHLTASRLRHFHHFNRQVGPPKAMNELLRIP